MSLLVDLLGWLIVVDLVGAAAIFHAGSRALRRDDLEPTHFTRGPKR